MTVDEVLNSQKEFGDYVFDNGKIFYKGALYGSIKSTTDGGVIVAWSKKFRLGGFTYITRIKPGDDFFNVVMSLIAFAKLQEVEKALDGIQ